jgi:glycosyltransferase involved in cell wall biosynthesis
MSEINADMVAIPLDNRPFNEELKILNSFIRKDKINIKDNVSLCITYGDSMYCFGGKKRIGCTVWETTQLPEGWKEQMNQLDWVWATTEWGKKVFIDSGINVPIRVVHEGVDPTFNPYASKIPEVVNDNFRFLSVGKYEKRKGFDVLLSAFSEEFNKDEKVELILQAYNPFIGINVEAWQLYNYKILYDNNVPQGTKIRFLPFIPSRKHMPSLYISCDAFVSPTRGEGWGLPVCEAMACGIPTIVTDYGGVTEFANKETAYMIEVEKMSEAADPPFIKPYEGSMWAEPNKDSLRKHMRYVFEHQEEAKTFGKRAGEHIRKEFSWKKAGEKAWELIG